MWELNQQDKAFINFIRQNSSLAFSSGEMFLNMQSRETIQLNPYSLTKGKCCILQSPFSEAHTINYVSLETFKMTNSITAFWDDSYVTCFQQMDVLETDSAAITRVQMWLNMQVYQIIQYTHKRLEVTTKCYHSYPEWIMDTVLYYLVSAWEHLLVCSIN